LCAVNKPQLCLVEREADGDAAVDGECDEGPDRRVAGRVERELLRAARPSTQLDDRRLRNERDVRPFDELIGDCGGMTVNSRPTSARVFIIVHNSHDSHDLFSS